MKANRLLFLIFLAGVCLGDKYCGYLGEPRDKIEQEIENCFSQQKQESRIEITVAYEVCLGFNYTRLNSTVASLYEKRRAELNKEVMEMAFDQCDFEKHPDRRPLLDDDSVNLGQEQIYEGECHKFFDKMIEILFRQGTTEESFDDATDDNSKLLKNYMPKAERKDLFAALKRIILPLIECEAPMRKLRTELLTKYMQQFVVNIINPDKPSFNWQNSEVLMNADLYALKSDRYDEPRFSQLYSNELDKARQALVLTPSSEPVLMEKRQFKYYSRRAKNNQREFFREQKQLTTEEKLEADKEKDERVKEDDMDTEDYYGMTLKELHDKKKIKDEKYEALKELEEGHDHNKDRIEIDDIWNPNLTINAKQLSDDDFDRYKIKGYDVDKQIKTLFAI